MRVVLLGPPGAGKGTQAAVVAKKLNVPHISTGEMLRAEVASGSPLGTKVKGILDSGNLVPDALMLSVIEERLSKSDCGKGFILDGFPRTLQQAKDLTVLLARIKKELTHVIEIKVDESILLDRMNKRAAESGTKRSDDNAEVFANRLKVYRELTLPLSQYYRENRMLCEVNGLGSIEEVTASLLKAIEPGMSR